MKQKQTKSLLCAPPNVPLETHGVFLEMWTGPVPRNSRSILNRDDTVVADGLPPRSKPNRCYLIPGRY